MCKNVNRPQNVYEGLHFLSDVGVNLRLLVDVMMLCSSTAL